MNFPKTLMDYLSDRRINFMVVAHAQSNSSMHSARSAGVRPDELAKAVVLKDRGQYIMCVLPASHRLVINWLDKDYNGRHQLAGEEDLAELFPDCAIGAVPPVGDAYSLKVVWDNRLQFQEHVYLESGDHEHLIQVDHDGFMKLMGNADHAAISCTPDTEEYYRHLH